MAAEQYEVQAVIETYSRDGNALWHIVSLKPDGTYHDYYFPQDTLEWRAAEYDIDPTDVEGLLDIVLHEPHKAPVGRDDPALKEGRVSQAVSPSKGTRVGDLEATGLYNAETKQDAKEAHLVRIEHAKANRVRVVSPEGKKDPLDKIRAKYLARVDRVEDKRKMVDERRDLYKRRRDQALEQIRKEA
ncbi:hypothetical protein [Streptomyces sp. NPDC055013]